MPVLTDAALARVAGITGPRPAVDLSHAVITGITGRRVLASRSTSAPVVNADIVTAIEIIATINTIAGIATNSTLSRNAKFEDGVIGSVLIFF